MSTAPALHHGLSFVTSIVALGWVCGCSSSSDVAGGGAGGSTQPTDSGVDAAVQPDAHVDAATDAQVVSVTFAPQAIAPSDPELSNPLRGQYLWLGTPAYPTSWPDVDSYQRWNWAQLEPSHGNYKWSLIDDEIAAAASRHGRFGMRIMALCQGCADHDYKNAKSSIPDDLADAVNPLIGAAPGDSDSYLIPDWNSEAYFIRLQELVDAIAGRYHDDPHFAWVDVFSYGNWGEMHLYPFTQPGGPYDGSTRQPITDDNAKRLVQMNAKAFSNKLLVINSEQKAALEAAVASVTPPIGLRVDCLGSDGLAGGQSALEAASAADCWRTAPFLTEWCQYNLGSSGADLFVQGEAQVREFHVSMLSSGNFTAKPTTAEQSAAFRTANVESGYRLRISQATFQFDPAHRDALSATWTWVNDNVAPTYLAWHVVVGLRGPVQGEAAASVELRKAMNDAPLSESESLVFSSKLASGTYTLYVRVDDAQGISPPMNLAMQGRAASGEYVLGEITLP